MMTTQSDALSTQSDNILIVTVTKIEAQAVLETFSQAAGKLWDRQAFGNKTYYNLGIHGQVPVYMVQSEMGIATPSGALLTVNQAIQDLHPQAVIMCGIAYGLQPGKQKLGDILIAKQLEYYEPQKIDIRSGQIPRSDRSTSAERLLDRFRSADNDWQGVQTHFGLILSGEKVVNDLDFRDWLLKTEPEAIGGEMEGAGLYAAARGAKVDWILVKAICDWADGEKNDEAHLLAAHNAAQFVLYALSLGGWDGHGPSRKGQKHNTVYQHYLSKLLERIGRVNFSVTGSDALGDTLLENIYIPLPTELAIDVEIKNYVIVSWWLGEEGQYLDTKVRRASSEVPLSARIRPEDRGWETDALKILINHRQEYYTAIKNEIEQKEKSGEFHRNIEDGIYLADLKLNINDVLAACNRLVILGHPGSGKSTSAKYLALCLAANQIENFPRSQKGLDFGVWPHGDLTPIYIELRNFVASKFFPTSLEIQPTSEHLWNYIQNEILSDDLQQLSPDLSQDLLEGTAIIILDGLDEIAFPKGPGKLEARQKQMRSLAYSIQDTYPKTRIIVTSRPYAYKGWKLPGFSDVILSPFQKQHRIELATKLYSTFTSLEEAAEKAKRLENVLKKVDKELKDNPLFLTLMATLFQRGEKEGLPTKAGDLYYQSIILLLDRWTKTKNVRYSLPDLLGGLTRDDLINKLAALAYDVHGQLGENPGTPEIPRGLLYEHIFSLEREDESAKASALLSYLSENAGVLVSPGQRQGKDVFHFAHRTFQEYLAARHIVRQCIAEGSFNLVEELIQQRPQMWRLPCLLVDDVLVQMEREKDLWDHIEDLLPDNPPDELHPNDVRCWAAWLAGQNAIDQRLHLAKELRRSEQMIKGVLLAWLAKIIETANCLSLQERVEVGEALGYLGDPRSGVGCKNSVPDIVWCHIPAGNFLLGTNRDIDLLAQEDEPDMVSVYLDEFYIAKYPITYSQYEAFVEDSGYSNRIFWTKAGWEWKSTKLHPEIYWNKEGWHISNHPVVGLTWFEAFAYTKWLTQKLGYKIRLPTEAEIQKAARGTDGRLFPYGNSFDYTKGNTRETGIGRTTPVGLFIDSLSPYGVYDMSGNIFEWSLSHWTNPYQHHVCDEIDVEAKLQRVRTGGSCQRDVSLARAAFRIGFDQDYHSYSSGFRIVCNKPGT